MERHLRGASFIDRVSKHRGSDSRNPGEDRLTEILAGVLERVPGLALSLAKRWTHPGREAAGEHTAATQATHDALWTFPTSIVPRALTQVRLTGGRRVDLDLHFVTGDDARPLIVRVEVKRTISASRGQVPAYKCALPNDGRPHTVILLGPRDSLTAEDKREVPPSVPRRSWQATARTIAAHPADDPVERWLLREILTFLHKEQLMDVEALGPEHFTALAYHREAITGLTAVCDIASAQLSALFGEVDSDDRRPGSPDKFTQSWEAPPGLEDDAWGNIWFDWGLYRSNAAINLPTLHFFAGLSTEAGTFGPLEWIQRLQQRAYESDHFNFESWSGDAERLRRIGLPQEVLRGRTLEDQGASVARWVKETHTVLKEHGPPSGPRSQLPRM